MDQNILDLMVPSLGRREMAQAFIDDIFVRSTVLAMTELEKDDPVSEARNMLIRRFNDMNAKRGSIIPILEVLTSNENLNHIRCLTHVEALRLGSMISGREDWLPDLHHKIAAHWVCCPRFCGTGPDPFLAAPGAQLNRTWNDAKRLP